jgi:hypothetical protein
LSLTTIKHAHGMPPHTNPYAIELPRRFDELPMELPRRFDELPNDLQSLVLRHTAASFVVEFLDIEYHTRHDDADDRWHDWSIPVIARYEFKLARRRASGPEMFARFMRALDP